MLETSAPLLVFIIILAVAFGVVNGFNDAANAIAPAIGTRAMSPRNAIILAAITNLLGAATGTAVAKTIGKGILVPEAISYLTVIAALASIIIWGTLATYLGLPISLTHGFIAGLGAAGVAVTGIGAVDWSVMSRVLSAVVTAPFLGFIGGLLMMVVIYWLFRRVMPSRTRVIFNNLQVLSSAFAAYAHGKNDGQMPIGIIVMALVAYYQDPGLWEHLSLFDPQLFWVILVPALAISAGTAMGGWRVIKTMGMRVTNLRPSQGFAAQAAAAAVIETASHLGIPISTTHCISSSIMGVGAANRFSAVRWGIAGNIVAAWVLTFPICGALGYFLAWLLRTVF
ncbi:MAG: inorganic phosphate transporter [Chloroflexota bacterium]